MTREEAIVWLKLIKDQYPSQTVATKAIDMAIDALEKPKVSIDYAPSPYTIKTTSTDLISRADAIDKLLSFKESRAKGVCGYDIGFVDGISHSINMIDLVPSVSAERVGEWIVSENGKYQTCSQCGIEMFHSNWGYCPNCGARMKGGTE